MERGPAVVEDEVRGRVRGDAAEVAERGLDGEAAIVEPVLGPLDDERELLDACELGVLDVALGGEVREPAVRRAAAGVLDPVPAPATAGR